MTPPVVTPAFESPLHVGRPNIGARERLHARIDEMLDRRWLSNDGPLVKEFEQRVCDYTNVKHCIALCNATIGLELAIRALGMSGEVIIPSFTFAATAHALKLQGITPVFCDIDPHTHHIDATAVERLITPRTTGILGVHLWGTPCDVDALSAIAQRHRLRLLYDAAHAFGCAHHGQMVGNFGQAEVFSFHATKFLNSSEGGAVVTNDDDLAAKLRLLRNFGFAGYDQVVQAGTNGKMSELCAAMGLTSFDSIAEFVAVNHRNYQCYQRELRGIPGVRIYPQDDAEARNYQYLVLEIDPQQAGMTRDGLLAMLHAENVLARRYFYPGCHQMEPYRSADPAAGDRLPHTESICQRVMQLPTGTAVNEADIRQIVQIIRSAILHPAGY